MNLSSPAESPDIPGPSLTAQLPQGTITVSIDYAEIPAQRLFSFATRANPKRAFLFLSHVLGKHLPVDVATMGDVHTRIAAHIPELPDPIVFVGMAETATCLGQGVFEAWLREHPQREALFLHTTRYHVGGAHRVSFEEAHSHAPQQWFFLPPDPHRRALLHHARSLVLIDDEISTGDTLVNLVGAMQSCSPALAHLHLAAITDWMGPQRRKELTSRCHIACSIGALLYGSWHFTPHLSTFPIPAPELSNDPNAPTIRDSGYGRLGVTSAISLEPKFLQHLAKPLARCDRVLVLGTGEFMHPAYVLARELHAASKAKVWMHATTRSPILTWGPIRNVLSFPDNYGAGVPNYVYNYQAGDYDCIFLCAEMDASGSLKHLARHLGARLFFFLPGGRIAEDSLC
ncbi:phosphoribosyltransferase domain-containing protein [Candidatus Symbiobacter mobilis]|uniref:TRSP domain C terminus to PRTase_2 n=1 Tax=Candidatus Symbiobacter mobilis CR TaxID=946483 RepID=U5N786_9BURK|nr:phosphoribosyltransferase domain-containing protein [Candidatus Symbiobacter mobilis]AGX87257.1 hypothetical protein Cenrod_1164 [Candidatus Symbiobacter mobilis CR]